MTFRHIILFVLFFSFYNSVIAQLNKVYEVDTISNLLKEPLPFDEPFILKIKADDNPLSVFYIEHRKKKNIVQTFNYAYQKKYLDKIGTLDSKVTALDGKIATLDQVIFKHPQKKRKKRKRKRTIHKRDKKIHQRNKLERKGFRSIPAKNFWVRKEGKNSFLYIKFDKHPYSESKNPNGKLNDILSPYKEYSIFIDQLHPKALTVYQFVQDGKPDQATAILNNISANQIEDQGYIYFVPERDSVLKFHKDSLAKDFKTKKTNNDIFEKYLAGDLVSDTDHSFLKQVNQLLSACDSSKTDIKICTDCCELLKTAQNLYLLKSSGLNANLLKGEIHIMDLKTKAKKLNIKTQLANLNKSKKAICNLEEAIQTMIINGKLTDPSANKKPLGTLITKLETGIKTLENISENEVGIKNKIIAKQDFLEPLVLGGDTYVYNFKTRGKFRIIPNFGYSSFGWFDDDLRNFTPTLGFHINFKPIKKDIPFRIYPNKTFCHRLSFATAWSLTSIKADGKREDFFSTSTLTTGFNYHLGGGVNLTTGAMWFRKIDPNPLINDKSLAVIPHFGLSIDLDLKEFINEFTDLIPSK